jgi:metal-responsive CopG/Arc/MetJ family transcriptional regulator
MALEVVTVKFQDDILKRIDESIEKHNFNSRTEFIREAVRDKLANLTKEELIEKFLSFRGKANKKTTIEENRKTREEVGRELMDVLEKRFTA